MGSLLPGLLAGPVAITEFMANNQATLADEDGDFPDWIELHNPAAANAVNLAGWFLTDSPTDLTRWRFPATNLDAGQYLIVFASDKDRRMPGAPLHANFKLKAGGEYLALVQPDGVTIATEFAPLFPPQIADVSFGQDTGRRQLFLLNANAPGRLWVPEDAALGTNWIAPAFDDSQWEPIVAPAGYTPTGLDQLNLPALTNGLAGYWKFDETNGTATTAADASVFNNPGQLINYPSNGVVWTPGRVAGALQFGGDAFQEYAHVPRYPVATTGLTVAAWIWTEVRPDGAMIASTGWGDWGSGQFEFGLRAGQGRLQATLDTSEGRFELPDADLLPLGAWQHVAFTAAGGSLRLYRNGREVAARAYTGTFMSPLLPGLTFGARQVEPHTVPEPTAELFWQGKLDELGLWQRRLDAAEIQALFQMGSVASASLQTDLRARLWRRNPTAYFRFPFTVHTPSALSQWRLVLAYNDGFVAWLNGDEIVRRNAPADLTWNAAATAAIPATEGVRVESFNLNDFENEIRPGDNLLAIQGLNRQAADTDFFIQPIVAAVSRTNAAAGSVYFPLPTPGAENIVGVSIPGPVLSATTQEPEAADDADEVRVTVHARPALAALAAVDLHYRVMFSNAIVLPMHDDGQAEDETAGDGIFSAVIPASASAPGEMVRYFISARDIAGRASRLPLFADPTGSPEYYGLVVRDPNPAGSLPMFQWFAEDPMAAHTRTGTRCAVACEGRFYDNVFVRARASDNSQKFDFNPGDRLVLARLPRPVDEINLNDAGADPTLVRPTLAFELYRRAGTLAPLAWPVRMRLNNTPDRLATLVEQVDEDFLRRNGLAADGPLYKLNLKRVAAPLLADATDGVEKKTRLNEDHQELQAVADGLDPARGVDAREDFLFDQFNVPNLVNELAVSALVMDVDGLVHNLFLYQDTGGAGEWWLIPWDKDWTFTVSGSAPDYPWQFVQQNRVYDALMAAPVTRVMVLRRLRTLMDQWLATADPSAGESQMENRVQEWSAVIAPYAGAEFTNALDRLQSFFPWQHTNLYVRHSVTNTANPKRAGIPPAQFPKASVRIGALEVSPLSGNPAEEFVCLTNPSPFAVDISAWQLAGAVRFTLAPGTVLAAGQTLYVVPSIRAFRARTNGPAGGQGWFVQGNYSGQLSARGETLQLLDAFGRLQQEATYPGTPSPAQLSLRITEIMFHPGAESGDVYPPEEYEYLELKNLGSDPLDLVGVRLVEGIQFDFTGSAVNQLPAGQSVWVARNRAAFAQRYGTNRLLAGPYAGSLDNGGERLRLIDARGEEVLDFHYHDDWQPLADGFGFALMITDDTASPDDWSRPEQWHLARSACGCPATQQVPAPATSPVWITEILPRAEPWVRSARIEIYNPNPDPVDLSGWFFSDAWQTPQRARIAGGTMVGAGAYRVFLDTDLTVTPGSAPPFAPQAAGGELYLFGADAAGKLTGCHHGFAFGPADPRTVIGRHVTSDGREQFVPLAKPTLGDDNAEPGIGPVVITEIHYHPATDTTGAAGVEFIELANLAPTNVALFDAASPAVTWRLADGVDYTFPTGVILAPDEVLLVTGLDPNRQPAALAAFRSRFGVPAAARVFGPWQGRLDNAGERVALAKPARFPTGAWLDVCVDAVRYRPTAPWPTGADGFGLSLQRRPVAGFGNEPNHWQAAPPTPGTVAAPAGQPPAIVQSPGDQRVFGGGTASFSVIAAGTAPLHYQWRFNGALLSGATNATFTLSNAGPQLAGEYEVAAFNQAGASVSPPARLTVDYPPVLLESPQAQNIWPGTNAIFSAAAYSPLPLRWQWYFQGAPLPDATNASLLLTNVQPIHDGHYSVVAADAIGAVTSRVARLAVLQLPEFHEQPQDQIVLEGEDVTFRLAVGGTRPFGYYWRRNGQPLLWFPGAPAVTITNVQLSDDGTRIDCIVTNLAQPFGVLSASAYLTVLADADRDRMADAWELEHDLSPNDPTDAAQDPDGDGLTNRQEYRAGTDPRDAQSDLRVERIAVDNTVQLEFTARANKSYTVVYTPTLPAATWLALTNVLPRPTNQPVTVNAPVTRTHRFFRLLISGSEARP